MDPRDDRPYLQMLRRGMSRRTFLQFTGAMTAALALPASYAPRVTAAVAAAPRIPVVWLHGQACGGDTRALLQASAPTTAELFLDLLSVEYHETLMAASGASAEAARQALLAAAPNGYLAVVEGAIPTGDGGVSCTVGGHAFRDIVTEVCGSAIATIAVGSCAFDGGAPAAGGGATGAVGVRSVVPSASVICLPGCPVNALNLAATIVHYLTFDAMPAVDRQGRPLFAYGNLLHNQCERRAHFEFGEFVQDWGDEGAQKGWCLYKLGCKGPETFANCPTERYADGTSWPVRAGHGCIGCTTAGFWDGMGPVYDRLPGPLPFAPQISADEVGLVMVGGVAALTVAHGAASSVRLRRWGAEERRARLAAASGPVAVVDETEPGGTEAAGRVIEPDVPDAGGSVDQAAEPAVVAPEAAEPAVVAPEAAEPAVADTPDDAVADTPAPPPEAAPPPPGAATHDHTEAPDVNAGPPVEPEPTASPSADGDDTGEVTR